MPSLEAPVVNKPTSPTRLYRTLRDQLGSIRKVYLRGNKVVRRDDFAKFDDTVLLLHGFMQTRNVWEVMEERLRADGYGVLSFNLGGLLWRYNTTSIRKQTQVIADKLEGISARYGLERFHIVAHSMGGLIARSYIQHHGGDRRVKSLITLGTPHTGTPTAAIGLGVMGAGLLSRAPLEMLPKSGLLRRLRRDPFPPAIPLASIYSKHDVVCPWPTSVLRPRAGECSMRNHVVRGIGHTALTYDPGVYRLIVGELDRAATLWKERGR